MVAKVTSGGTQKAARRQEENPKAAKGPKGNKGQPKPAGHSTPSSYAKGRGKSNLLHPPILRCAPKFLGELRDASKPPEGAPRGEEASLLRGVLSFGEIAEIAKKVVGEKK